MSRFSHRFSIPFFSVAIRVVTLALFLVVVGTSTALPVTNTVTAPDEQVPFSTNGTAVLTSVTKLPGGLTQKDFIITGTATHLGDFTGPATRIEDNHGNYTGGFVLIGANGKDTIFVSTSGRFETSKDKCVITSTGTFTVTGGTGAFTNATGSGIILTEVDVCATTGSGLITGTISKPNSN